MTPSTVGHGRTVDRLASAEFRREREAHWAELEAVLREIDRRGLRSLDPARLARLPHLYRSSLSSLSVARAISLDQALLDYLENLTSRAYFAMYAPRRHLRQALADFLIRFPAEVRRQRWHLALAGGFLALGALAAFFIVAGDADRFYSFVDPAYATGRDPSATTAALRGALYDEGSVAEALASFAAFLFTHNAQIGMLAFALGFIAGVPVFVLMFLNGLTLGAFAALYHGRGLSIDLWGWLLPHGVTELLAVALCGGAGLALGQALVFPGRTSRLAALAGAGRRSGVIVLGAVMLLLIAGLIEGIFRQTVHSVAIRYAVAATTAIAWIAYFGWYGRRATAAEAREAGP